MSKGSCGPLGLVLWGDAVSWGGVCCCGVVVAGFAVVSVDSVGSSGADTRIELSGGSSDA